jgi:S-formylglutathione hydrolase FrmB
MLVPRGGSVATPSRIVEPWRRWYQARYRLPGFRNAVFACLALAAAALAVAGGIGLFRYFDTYWLYRGFAPPSAPRTVVVRQHGVSRNVRVEVAQVQRILVTSPAIGGFRDPVDVVLPPGYASNPSARYPVLYLLHGDPGEPSNFLTVGDIQTVESVLVAAGKMRPLILVLPTGGHSFLSDTQWANGADRYSHWETFIAQDLVEAIDTRYRTISDGRDRGIAGLSEGGYGALNIGLHHPGEFSLLESWSGYMSAEGRRTVFRDNTQLITDNSPIDTVRLVAPQLRAAGTFIWFYCGSADPLAPQDQAFSAELGGLGIAHRFFEVRGGHSWALWREEMAAALVTASEHLSDA